MSSSRADSIINRNRRKREVRTNETVEESFIRRRNKRDRVVKCFCVQSKVSELQKHSCGNMSGFCSFTWHVSEEK
ncbi:hypothetical protein AVEN_179839-1, partial [Araneus ventricosus]